MTESKKVALVTGCGKRDGIGAAIARRLSAAGCAMVVMDVETKGVRDSHEPTAAADPDWQGVDSLVDELIGVGGEAMAVVGDISVATDVARAIEQVIEKLGSVDILVNNAGAPFSMAHGDLVDVDPEEFARVLAINVTGTFLMGRAVAPHMRARRWGRIINIASTAGRFGSKMNSAYSASKAGVIALAQTWAVDLGSEGITANAVLPGYIFTSRTLSGLSKKTGIQEPDQALIEKSAPPVPAGRAGTPKDVAATVAFLASEDASYTNGQSLIVDGGFFRM